VELAVGVEPAGEACLGPCIDVQILAAGTPGEERPSISAPGLVPAPDWSSGDRARFSPLPTRRRESPGTAGHIGYTILRC
jgi:hypothetical protein